MKSPGFEPSLQTAVKYGVQQFQPDQAQFTIKILFLNFDNCHCGQKSIISFENSAISEY